jgi:hypothetical protein
MEKETRISPPYMPLFPSPFEQLKCQADSKSRGDDRPNWVLRSNAKKLQKEGFERGVWVENFFERRRVNF